MNAKSLVVSAILCVASVAPIYAYTYDCPQTVTGSSPTLSSATYISLSDDGSQTITIPFTFSYWTTTTNQIGISANGYLMLTPSTKTGRPSSLPSNSASSGNTICAWCTDLNPATGGTIYYTTLGSVGFRVFYVRWDNVPYYSNLANRVTVSIELHESTNMIQINIENAEPSPGRPVTIGLNNGAGNDGVAYLYNGAQPSAINSETAMFMPLSTTTRASGYACVTTGGSGVNIISNSYDAPVSVPYVWPGSNSPTTLSLSDDSISSSINIGFNFRFWGTSYSSLFIASNGFVTFSSGGNTGVNTPPIPNSDSPNNMICGWCTDLVPSNNGASVTYDLLGNAGSRSFVIKYNNVPYYGDTSHTVTFAIVLYEASNQIEVFYNTMQTPSSSSRMVTAGVENTYGTDGTQYSDFNEASPSYLFNVAWRVTPTSNPNRQFGCPTTSDCHSTALSGGATAGIAVGASVIVLVICCTVVRRKCASTAPPRASPSNVLMGKVALASNNSVVPSASAHASPYAATAQKPLATQYATQQPIPMAYDPNLAQQQAAAQQQLYMQQQQPQYTPNMPPPQYSAAQAPPTAYYAPPPQYDAQAQYAQQPQYATQPQYAPQPQYDAQYVQQPQYAPQAAPQYTFQPAQPMFPPSEAPKS